MWIWKEGREVYVCVDCKSDVRWNRKTGVGWCKCRLFAPDKKGECPPQFFKGKFKSR